MSEPSFLRSHEYDYAFNVFMRKALEGEIARDPLLRRTLKRTTNHSGRLRHVFEEIWNRTPTRFEASYTIPREATRESDFACFHLEIRALGEKFRVQLARSRAETLEEGVKRSRQIIPGNPVLTWDNLLRALEHINVSFNEDGEPRKFEIEAGGGALKTLAQSIRPVDFDERVMEIVERKREEWDAKKRRRRLS
ncbi:MAG: hypothetical protein GC165_20380 [Armatimonadetes bacterium]|nr:hypothetical protein [Armatimonadota bacterium]